MNNIQGITPIVKTNSGCDYHRIVLPMKCMGFDMDEFTKKNETDPKQIWKETKVLYFNRDIPNTIEKIKNEKKKYGFKLLMDLDDYWILNHDHTMYKMWNKNKIGEKIVSLLKIADAVTTTTTRLADKVKEINKNVHVIPNGIPFGYEQFNDKKIYNDKKIRFVYTGSATHLEDVALLRSPLSKINSIPLLNAEFTLVGYTEATPESKRIWKKMESVFNPFTKKFTYCRKSMLPIDEYMDCYSEADVVLVPLIYNIFNPYKSNLKILEAGCKNLPAIVSSVPPYIDDDVLSDAIMWASSGKDWINHIQYCCENPNFVTEEGLALGQTVRAYYDLFKINEYRQQLFDNLKA